MLSLVFGAGELLRPTIALSQTPLTPFPGQAEPGRNVPAPAPAPTPQFDFSIPSPQRGPVPRAVDQIEFDVNQINVVGATVFSADAFVPLTKPLIGQKAKLSDVIDIADKIEQMYRQHGYVLTRAFVPPQTVSNGVFQINVVEGFVKAAAVSGGDEFQRQRVDKYVQPVTEERPATLATMERALLLSNDLPGTQASGLLRPSPTEPGASDLLVNLIGQPWEATLYTDNRGSAVTGPWTLGADFVANQLYYIPGQITLDLSGTPDMGQRRLFQGTYARPVGSQGMIFTLAGVTAHGVPAAAGGNLVSDSFALSGKFSYPVIMSRPTRLTVEAGLTTQGESVTQTGNAAGTLIAAGLPTVVNDDRWHELNLSATLQQRDLYNGSTTGATFGVTQGIPWFGAKSTAPASMANGASTGFTKYTLVAQHDQPIKGPWSANFHGLAQYTGQRLVIGEQTSFGGSGIGRGYDPAALAADIGFGLASEIRYDMHFPQYNVDTAQLYSFFDEAQVRPLHDEGPPPAGTVTHRTIMSIGFGLRLAVLQRFTGGIEFAQELRGVPNNDTGKTDTRILFNAAMRF